MRRRLFGATILAALSARIAVRRLRVELVRQRRSRRSSPHPQHRERASARSRRPEGVLRPARDRDPEEGAAERQRRRPRARERRRRHRLPRLRAGDDRPRPGDQVPDDLRERGRGHERRRQLAEHHGQGQLVDPHAAGSRRQDDRRQRAQGRRRGDDQGGAEEGRRRSELAEAPRARLRRDAVGAQQRADRRVLGTGAVRVAGPEHRRRPDRDGAGAGARQVLADRRLRRAGRAGCRRTRSSRSSSRRDQPVARVRAGASGGDPRAPAAGTQNVRLPIWSPVVDRDKLVQLAKYAKEFGVIDSLPNLARLCRAA